MVGGVPEQGRRRRADRDLRPLRLPQAARVRGLRRAALRTAPGSAGVVLLQRGNASGRAYPVVRGVDWAQVQGGGVSAEPRSRRGSMIDRFRYPPENVIAGVMDLIVHETIGRAHV